MRVTRFASTLTLLALATPACFDAAGPGDQALATSYAAAIPAPDEVELRMPNGDPNPNALTLGETAEFYLRTYEITHHINGLVYGLLSTLRDVVSLPPTSHTETEAVWGPHTGALEPATYMLVVRATGENSYAYTLFGRPRSSTDDGDFAAILEGTAEPARNPGDSGSGEFTLDWTTLAGLNPAVDVQGRMTVTYGHEGLAWRTVEMFFEDFVDGSRALAAEATDVVYRYLENADLSGDFQFAFEANMHGTDAARSAPELVRIRSRWVASGSGRSDVQVSSPEIEADLEAYLGLDQDYVAASECWDDNFLRTWYDESPIALSADDGEPLLGSVDGPGQGDEEACPFQESLFADDDVTVVDAL